MEGFLASVVHGANAISRPVAFSLHICFAVTYAAHVYRHRVLLPRESWARSLFLFPLQHGWRHSVFQVFAWGLWCLSAAITLPIYLSLLAVNPAGINESTKTGIADSAGNTPAAAITTAPSLLSRANLLLDHLGLRQPLIPLTHVDAASGAAAVSGLWGELFLLKALLVFEGAAAKAKSSSRIREQRRISSVEAPVRGVRRSANHDGVVTPAADAYGLGVVAAEAEGRPRSPGRSGQQRNPGDGGLADGVGQQQTEDLWRQQRQLLAPRLASLLVCLMGMALSVTGFVLLLALEHMPDTASRVLYCCLALSCVFIGASSTHGLGGHLRYCAAGAAGAAESAGAALGVLRRLDTDASTNTDSRAGKVAQREPAAAAETGSDGTHERARLRRVSAPVGGAAAAAGGAREARGAVWTSGGETRATPCDSNGGFFDDVSHGQPAGGAAAVGLRQAAAVEGGAHLEAEEDAEEVEAGEESGWRFFQPFQGGSVFVATQAIGWTLFSSTVVAVLLLAKQLVAGVGYCLRCWALAVGALMVATQLMLGVSLLTYQHRRRARKLLLPVLHHPGAVLARAAGLVMPVVMMYLPLHVSCSSVAAVFVLLPPRQAAAAVLVVLLPYFFVTLRGYPAHSGCRRWEWLCRWFSREVEGSLAWWAGRLEVVRDFEGTAHELVDEHRSREAAAAAAAAQPAPSLSLPRRYVLGFHPHGLYPTGAGFLPLMPTVQAVFPGTTLVTLTASIVHYLPGLRDIAGWAGFRQVTRSTFRRALHDTGAVLLCPGGQAELVYADRAFPARGTPGAAAAAAAAAAPPAPPVVVRVISGPGSGSGSAPDAIPGAESVQSSAAGGAVQIGVEAEAEEAAAAGLRGDKGEAAAGGGEVVVRARAGSLPLGWGPRPPPPHQLVVYAGHQGFVRLALEEGAWLVPVLALGETLQLRNLISAPELQRATYKRIGFPVPFILAGRWGLTTLPLRNPLVYAVGRPLPPPPGWEAERLRQILICNSLGAPVAPPAAAAMVAGGSAPHDDRSGTAVGFGAQAQTPGRLHRRRRAHGSRDGTGASAYKRAALALPQSVPSAGAADAASAAVSPVVVVPQTLVDEYHSRFYEALGELWMRHRHRHPVLAHADLVLEWGPLGPPGNRERAR